MLYPCRAFRRTLFPVLLLLFAVTACHKAPLSPEKAKQQRLAWNMATTVDAYNSAGFTNALWNFSALNCLKEFARVRAGELDPDETSTQVIASNATEAVDAGCKDPMVYYLYIRYAMSQSHTKEEFFKSLYKDATDMNNSSYPAVRKFYAQARALDQIYYAYGTNSSQHPEKLELLNDVLAYLPQALSDKTIPPQEAYEASTWALYLVSGSQQNHDVLYQQIDQVMTQDQPDSYATWLLKGEEYVRLAWDARGSGYSGTVSKEGWDGFNKNLSLAQDALERAWKLDPHQAHIAEEMMTVMLGQGGGRERMEVWFNRAMEVNTNDYDACHSKLYYLEPKWYGSDADELAFGRECVQSTKWGGHVPLILVDAHANINSRNSPAGQADYWKRPDVWADIQAAYERFFELNPDATGYYHNYAWYAYHAEQWDKLNELIPKLGEVNYNFFGGKDEYDKMVELAKQHAGAN